DATNCSGGVSEPQLDRLATVADTLDFSRTWLQGPPAATNKRGPAMHDARATPVASRRISCLVAKLSVVVADACRKQRQPLVATGRRIPSPQDPTPPSSAADHRRGGQFFATKRRPDKPKGRSWQPHCTAPQQDG